MSFWESVLSLVRKTQRMSMLPIRARRSSAWEPTDENPVNGMLYFHFNFSLERILPRRLAGTFFARLRLEFFIETEYRSLAILEMINKCTC